MKIFKLIRASEWWEYKFPPIFIVPYFIVLKSGLSLSETLKALGFILIALATGAIYVSVLNDLTDFKEDAMAGKKNRLKNVGRLHQILLLLLPVFTAALLSRFMSNNPLALVMYVSAYVCFTLYSLPPFRFKQRGVAGIIADASGSQLFPTLFAVAYMASAAHYVLTLTEIVLVAIWSFCFGLRGILWHQFHDIENDRRSGLFTIVQSLNNRQIQLTGRLIIVVEIAALSGILMLLGNYYFFTSIFIYFSYLLLRKRKTNVQIIILKYTQMNYSILMNEYYQVFLPVILLVILCFFDVKFIFLLILSLFLFPYGINRVLKNTFYK